MRLLLFIVLLLGCFRAPAQAIRNFDFEPDVNRNQPLLFWARKQVPDELLIRLDSVAPAQHGRGSLLLDMSRAETPVETQVFQTLPVDDSLRGQTVTFSAWVRTEGFTGTVWLQGFSSDYPASSVGLFSDRFTEHSTRTNPLVGGASTTWQRLQLQLPISQTASAVVAQVIANGKGRVWLDNYQVQWNNRTYPDRPLPGTEPLVLAPATPLPDWDFEQRGPALVQVPRPAVRRWFLDSTVAQHGRRSLRIESAPADAAPVYLGVVPLDSLQGKELTIRGYVRYTAGATPAALPKLLYRITGNSNRRTWPYDRFKWADVLRSKSLPTPTDEAINWQRFEIKIPISKLGNPVSELALLLQPGTSPIWLDHIELLANGLIFAPEAPPVPGQPKPAELAWLRKAALPLRTATADGGDQKDLAAFGQLVGSAQLIGLGEVTLGSHEQMQLKHRLFRYLVEQKGVRMLAVDADLGTCLALNDYLQTGKGNVKQLVASLGTWDTAEMLALVQWMRTYNEHASSKLQLLGIGIRDAPEGLTYLRGQLPPASLKKLAELQRQLRQLGEAGLNLQLATQPEASDPLLDNVRRLWAEVRSAYDVAAALRNDFGTAPDKSALVTQLLRTAEQFSIYTTLFPGQLDYEAACLAENVQWVRAQAGGGRVVVWSHNDNLAAHNLNYNTLGQWLRRRYGMGYVAVAMAFAEGTFRGLGTDEPPTLTTATAPAAAVGSYEYYFRSANLPVSMLDLRTATPGPETQWLYENLLLREGRLKPYPQPFNRHNLLREFDVLLYVPKSTPAQAVP